MHNENYDVIVIGGGPAGMMAAGRAGELGAKVLLLEKNDRLGKKLSITGGRRCNITNAEFDNRIFLDNFPESKQFLFSPFSQFNVESTFEFFESRGLPLVVEDRKRAFPKSQKAEDVCSVLSSYVAESGNVTVKLRTAVESFIVDGEILKGIRNPDLKTGLLPEKPDRISFNDVLHEIKKFGNRVIFLQHSHLLAFNPGQINDIRNQGEQFL